MSRKTWLPIWATLGTSLVALVSAAPALADTTIGHTGGNVPCFGGWVAIDANYVVPASGTITSFSYGDDGANAGAQLDFEVLSPNGDGTYTIVGDTGLQTLTGAVGDETFPAQIAAGAGDVIGYYETGTDNCLQGGTLDSTSAVFVGSDPSVGQTVDASTGYPYTGSVNESANLEASATPPLTATAGSPSGTEGAPTTGQVATFSDPDNQAVGQYSATISWGDGSSSAGTISQVSPGQYAVAGSHAYAKYGSYPVSVQIEDQDGSSAQTHGTASIADAALAASGLGSTEEPAAAARAFSGQVASLTDQNPSGSAADFTATVDWGDGTSSSATVTGSGGSYSVTGSHSYGADGPYTVRVHVADAGGSLADATSYLVVYENASRGGFVVGDRVRGPLVYFYGPAWALMNPMSGGRAPEDFRGFVDASAQSCGQTFTVSPGRSEMSEGRLPSYMAVAVTGQMTRSRGLLSGKVAKVLVVRTYPEPRVRGIGQVVATVCG